MRILIVADLHYSLKQFDWLASHADDFDVVCIAGDLLEIASAVSLPAQVVVIRSYLERIAPKTRLMVCSGNHDLTEPDATGERVAHWMQGLSEIDVVADGSSTMVGDTLFSALPWWDGRKTRQRVAAQLAEDSQKEFKNWYWLHHAPPAESPTAWNGMRHYGDSNLPEWIERYRPTAVFSGHVHQAPFVPDGAWVDRIGETSVFNMGQQIGEIPAHIIFDSAENEAAWFSIMDIQCTGLSEAPAPKTGIPDWVRA